ncbi:MAG: aldehyde dehydrogenase family protein [Streptosporangiaceae bacterium]|jgi:acyl-CoA reductase-like NAD-dependent aldehyde dehydrogenase
MTPLQGALDYAAQPKQLLIGGKWSDAYGQATTITENPVTGGILATLAEAQRQDVDAAVESARSALGDAAWASLRPRERAQLLFRLADAIEERTDEFAALEAIDSGKPLRNATNVDIPQAIDHLRYFAGWVTKIEGSTITSNVGDYLIYTRREPVGVCALIVPWNYPLLLTMWKLAPALACGNTVILKPAEQTSLTALRLGELACELDFPPGVINVLTGRGEITGAALAAHPGVDKVSFTGSTEVGKSIAAAGAANLTRVSLELGGKSPNVVFADADLDAAASGAAWGIFYNMGEDCCAGSRLFVQEPVFDEFLAKVTAAAQAIKVGHPFEDGSQLGPLVSSGHHARVSGYVDGALADGATVVTGGGRPDYLPGAEGYYYSPTILTDVTPDARIVREEVFGPVVVATPFTDDAHAVRVANDTCYGLAAGVWTQNLGRAHRFADAVKAGTIWLNDFGPADAAAPFGGFKQSGYGREHGGEALNLFLETKSVWVNLAS